jgi:hypothetical protein
LFFFTLPLTTVIIFNPERFRGTLNSRWQEQNQLLCEITASFCSQKWPMIEIRKAGMSRNGGVP